MKKNFLSVLLLSVITLSAIGCKDKAKEATTTEAESIAEVKAESTKFTADVTSSTIAWTGFKPTGSHNGTININSGSFEVVDGNITGGNFAIDMGSIVVLDIPAEKKGNAKLAGHLKSGDFFDVESYPNATFNISGLEIVEGKTMLSGNLTLKDATNNVTFPVSISHDNDTMTLTSETFTIDRSKWNVKHQSKSFFNDLGDKFINDDIELKISVKAAKA